MVVVVVQNGKDAEEPGRGLPIQQEDVDVVLLLLATVPLAAYERMEGKGTVVGYNNSHFVSPARGCPVFSNFRQLNADLSRTQTLLNFIHLNK